MTIYAKFDKVILVGFQTRLVLEHIHTDSIYNTYVICKIVGFVGNKIIRKK